MKKSLLAILIFGWSFNMQAQNYFAEDFENGIGQFTSTDNDGDGNEWSVNPIEANGVSLSNAAISNSWANNVILTPDNLLTSEAIDLSGASAVSLEFVVGNVETTNNWWEEYYDVIVTSTNDVSDITSAPPMFGEVLPEGGVMLERKVDLTQFAGQTIYITFRHHNCTDKNFLILDDVVVKELQSDDVELSSVNIDAIIVEGDVTISGIIQNEGANPVNGFDIIWDDGTGPYSETFSETLEAGESYNFTHATTLAATAGNDYNLSICVSANPDLNDTNDCIEILTSCASQEGKRLPLMEVFTSSTCPPCYTLATTGFGGQGLAAYLKSANANAQENAQLAIISYQVNWPAAGDHAYNSDVQTRTTYYAVGGAPTLLIDAEPKGVPADVTAAGNIPTYADIEAKATITGNDVLVEVDVNAYASYEGARLHVAILDDEYAAGSAADQFTNGETEFHHVMRKMIPTADGALVNLEGGQMFSSSEMYTTSEVPSGFPAQGSFETHIGSEREVVVFLQDANGGIINAAIAEFTISDVDELAGKPFNVFPNPTSGEITIDLLENEQAFFTLYTVNGQTLKTGNLQGKSTLDLSNYESGFYLISLRDTEGNLAVSKVQVIK